jgi:hypothetical protein
MAFACGATCVAAGLALQRPDTVLAGTGFLVAIMLNEALLTFRRL